MTKRSLISAAAAFLLLLSACSSGGESDGEAASGDESDEAAEEESIFDIEYESPLGEFLGWSNVNFDAEDEQARFEQQEREAQEQIAACMRAEGFEYTPVDQGSFDIFGGDESPDGLEWGSQAWTEKYGYGVSTMQFSQAQVGDDLVGHNYDEFSSGDGEVPTDPNQTYVESLGPNEQDAYYGALYGDFAVEEPDWILEEREPTQEEIEAYDEALNAMEPTGCENVAYEEIYGGGGDNELFEEFDQEFSDLFEEMEERMESHPDVIAYRDGVKSCMSEKGLEYFSSQDGDQWEYFNNLVQEANIGPDQFGDPLADVDTTGWTDEQFEDAYENLYNAPLPADQLVELGRIQTLEIDTALGELECGGGWRNELEATNAIRIEMEQQFLDENADRLAKYEGVFGN